MNDPYPKVKENGTNYKQKGQEAVNRVMRHIPPPMKGSCQAVAMQLNGAGNQAHAAQSQLSVETLSNPIYL